jgi:hypothetical protein
MKSNDQESDLTWCGTQRTSGFTKDSHFWPCRARKMGGYYATRAQWVDLLGYLRQKTGNPKAAHWARMHGT